MKLLPRQSSSSWLLSLHALLITFGVGESFVVSHRPAASKRMLSSISATPDDLGSTTVSTDKYDIVKVDLSDDRDYPIYIGTGYADEEGRLS